ncbi:carboxymuconolactone decarboxylase family protein [Sorangium sp. So ce1335]|uniref:carboxymuconolactone decarboxylase family protein n=1 Tax=Sorangium sp. So ce1335 TaxID=3133335 RepID=UPI003F616828
MSEQSAVKYEQVIPDVLQALAGVHHVLEGYGLERKLIHLIQLRASQINQCAFCVRMHTRDARQDGETNDRLDRLIVWEHVRDFSERERAAFAWTEALTSLDRRTDYSALRARLREHFSEREIGALTAAVAMINLWNRVQVSRH